MSFFSLAVGHSLVFASLMTSTSFASAPVGWREGSCGELKAQAKEEYHRYLEKMKELPLVFESAQKAHGQFMEFFGEDGDYRFDLDLDQAIPIMVSKLIDEPKLLRNVSVSNLARWKNELPSHLESCEQGGCSDNSYVDSLNDYLMDDEEKLICDESSISFSIQDDDPGFMMACRPSIQTSELVNYYFKFSSGMHSYIDQNFPFIATRDVSMSIQNTSFLGRAANEKNFIEIWSDFSLTYDLISEQYIAKTYGPNPTLTVLGDDLSKVDVKKLLSYQLTFSPLDGGFYGYDPVDMSSAESYWESIAPRKCHGQLGRMEKYDEMLSWVKE